jgi:F0F1-type ATP synthase membrane subunit b/b'
MGHRLTASEETALLRQVTREAHEATQALRAAIKEAKELSTALVGEFERIHASEIKQLSNFFTGESNRAAAYLNAAVEQARTMIAEQIMAGEAVFDRGTATVSIKWGGMAFDSQVPLPFPEQPTWKETQ